MYMFERNLPLLGGQIFYFWNTGFLFVLLIDVCQLLQPVKHLLV